jgi:uncharacterized membrane protein
VVEAEKNEENFKQCEGRVQAVFIANFRKAFLGDGVEGRWVVEAEARRTKKALTMRRESASVYCYTCIMYAR